MSARELLERCRVAGLRARVDGAELVVRGRPAPELLEALREHKQDVLDYLRDARTAHVHPCACCGKFFFSEPAVVCYWCRRRQDDAPVGEPCPGCGEACERCIGHPTPEVER